MTDHQKPIGSGFGERTTAGDVLAIQDYLTKRLADLGLSPAIEQQNVGRDNLLNLVAQGSGLTVVSEAATAVLFPGLIYRPIAGEDLPFCAVWSRRNDNPAFRRFLSMGRSLAKKAERAALLASRS